MGCITVVAASAVKGAELLALIEEEAAANEMAAASVADGTDPFARFWALDEPFLGRGTPAAALQSKQRWQNQAYWHQPQMRWRQH